MLRTLANFRSIGGPPSTFGAPYSNLEFLLDKNLFSLIHDMVDVERSRDLELIVTMPRAAKAVEEGTILVWVTQVGEQVSAGDTLRWS